MIMISIEPKSFIGQRGLAIEETVAAINFLSGLIYISARLS